MTAPCRPKHSVSDETVGNYSHVGLESARLETRSARLSKSGKDLLESVFYGEPLCATALYVPTLERSCPNESGDCVETTPRETFDSLSSVCVWQERNAGPVGAQVWIKRLASDGGKRWRKCCATARRAGEQERGKRSKKKESQKKRILGGAASGERRARVSAALPSRVGFGQDSFQIPRAGSNAHTAVRTAAFIEITCRDRTRETTERRRFERFGPRETFLGFHKRRKREPLSLSLREAGASSSSSSSSFIVDVVVVVLRRRRRSFNVVVRRRRRRSFE